MHVEERPMIGDRLPTSEQTAVKGRRPVARSQLLWLASFLGLAVIVALRAEGWLRALLLYLSGAGWARSVVSDWPVARSVARRFVAGERLEEAMEVTHQLNQSGLLVSLDYLGESITTADEARAARDEILRLLDAIEQCGANANVSVKLSQLGVKIDKDLALHNMLLILQRAQKYHNKIRIDMEESGLVETTFRFYETLRYDYECSNVGVVIQSYLYRSEEDVRKLVKQGAWVRLVKGAYMEPPSVAFPEKADVDANFIRLMRMLLSEEALANGVYPAIATHDEKMIAATLDFVDEYGIPAEAFEFQMLYGIRRELQDRLAERGYQVRVYVPYGTAWYPYLTRRLAERPANLWFFLSNLLRK